MAGDAKTGSRHASQQEYGQSVITWPSPGVIAALGEHLAAPDEARRGHDGWREVPPPPGVGEQERVPVSVGKARHVADPAWAGEEYPADPLGLRPQRGSGPERGERRRAPGGGQ